MAADYDSGEITPRERKAAKRQFDVDKYNAQSTKNHLKRQLANYDMAEDQARDLTDVELDQNARKLESDRFEAQRDLASAALGLFGSMNQAMNGSTVGNFMRMLENRSDKDNSVYWTQHQVNNDATTNAFNEFLNQNQVNRNDAVAGTEKALRDQEASAAAAANNINPNLYQAPGTGDADFGSRNIWKSNAVKRNNSELSGYVMPDNSVQEARRTAPRNRLRGNDYFSRMVNSFNAV